MQDQLNTRQFGKGSPFANLIKIIEEYKQQYNKRNAEFKVMTVLPVAMNIFIKIIINFHLFNLCPI